MLGTKFWFLGDAPTLAAMMLAPTVASLAATPEGAQVMGGISLPAFVERRNARPGMQRTMREYLLAA
jgi:glutathione S-transferase